MVQRMGGETIAKNIVFKRAVRPNRATDCGRPCHSYGDDLFIARGAFSGHGLQVAMSSLVSFVLDDLGCRETPSRETNRLDYAKLWVGNRKHLCTNSAP